MSEQIDFYENRPKEIWQADIRDKRNNWLLNSDWTQLPDVPESTRLAWQAYRQELRDITSTDEFINDPINVVWPTEPGVNNGNN